MEKIAYTLYRVSTKKQLYSSADNKDDIPMQRQSCQEFAERMGWKIGREFKERGISGAKVSAANRDAIQDLKDAALKGEFQILLVFMFDRLGRIDDETPFVLEWFVKHGIECWSVKEGQQKIEQHTDKLTNYIRFWQAAGESEKTSIRTKERLGQIVKAGFFRGGTVPYGYRLEKQGRLNKERQELHEILVDEEESKAVQMIFNLYINQGYGTHRIGSYLFEMGILTRKGNNFTAKSIRYMLSNKMYLGILRSGESESDVIPSLQIIDQYTFEAAQNILYQRSGACTERRIPLNTKGSSLLSGNVFCGHCGARLIITTNGKKYYRQDGEVTVTQRIRYVCYNKTRHSYMCDGQTGYTAKKLDAVIETIVGRLFQQLHDVPKTALVAEKYARNIMELKTQLQSANVLLREHSDELLQYESEVIKILRGESRMNPDLLNKLYEDAKEKTSNADESVKLLEKRIKNAEKMKDTLAEQYDTIKSWADMYDECNMASKKMIVSRLMKSIRVRRGYEIEVDLTVDCEKVGIGLSGLFEESLPSDASEKAISC